LRVEGIGHERLPKRPGHLLRFNAQDPHRSAVHLDKPGIKVLIHVSDRSLLKKIPKAFLALPQCCVGLAQLFNHPAFYLFQFGDLSCSQLEFHLVHDQRRQLRQHLRFRGR